ncbi:hypothetical protein GGR55DRAFT_674842 [Xylaria sp. FL0064]|nr:hypothetical protein GGR55DRAFT_674842 [Xylaria sp. FL0064]
MSKPSAWDIIRSGPITLLSVTMDIDGQLYQNVISGPKLDFDCPLEEGVYILCGNRGLLIASSCDRRKCYVTQVCHCAEHVEGTINNSIESRGENTGKIVNKTVRNWLHFRQAAQVIVARRLCFLANPRTLSWNNIFDDLSFHFDSEIEEYYASMKKYASSALGLLSVEQSVKECPPGIIELISNAWRDYIESGDYDFTSATTPSDQRSSQDTENRKHHTNGGNWNDSTASGNHHRETPRPEDDLTEKSPLLKKVLRISRLAKEGVEHLSSPRGVMPPQSADSTSSNNNVRTTDLSPFDDEGPPAPVIMPPRNMRVGRGLMRDGNDYARL